LDAGSAGGARRRAAGAEAGRPALSPRWAATTTPLAIIVALSAVLARCGFDARRLNPWYFPSAEAYRDKLEQAHFAVEEIAIVPRPTTLPTASKHG